MICESSQFCFRVGYRLLNLFTNEYLDEDVQHREEKVVLTIEIMID